MSKRISITMDDELIALIEAEAIETGYPQAKVVTDILRKGLKLKPTPPSLFEVVIPMAEVNMMPKDIFHVVTFMGYDTTINTVNAYRHQIRKSM